MDGNGRWARRRGLPRTDGHTAGEEALANIVRVASQRNIGWLTVYGFSTENWVRPRTEVRHILSMHKRLFGRIDELNENNVRVRWIGRQFNESGARTPAFVQRSIEKAIDDTRNNTGMTLTVAFDYGSRAELTRSARLSSDAIQLQNEVKVTDITRHLYDPEMPPVDVLIRTSGESRISNFLLWQIAGAKVFFTERTWPDISVTELDAAIALVEPTNDR
jgi:undecaprenyl diphosphate synthase